VRAVHEIRKLSTTEEWHQDQGCSFQQGDYKNKGHNLKKLSWIQVSIKTVSVAQKLSTIEEWRKEQKCLFWQRDYRNYDDKPENVLGSSLGEYVGFRDKFFSVIFNDTY
jgi:hypothetical protein